MHRSDFLYYGPDPLAVNANTFDIREGAVVLAAAGIPSGVVISIERRVDAYHGKTRGLRLEAWGPVVRAGCPLQLSASNTQVVMTVPGTYRAVVVGTHPTLVVTMYDEEGPSTLLSRVAFAEASPQCGGGSSAQPFTSFSAPVDFVVGDNVVTHSLGRVPAEWRVRRGGSSVEMREVSRSATTITLFSPVALAGNIIYTW